jgi:hypothetical protein|tara:strand:+ start:340 stop:525 length:186 start_codon:yes stop_codon:yes gene_type:complete
VSVLAKEMLSQITFVDPKHQLWEDIKLFISFDQAALTCSITGRDWKTNLASLKVSSTILVA